VAVVVVIGAAVAGEVGIGVEVAAGAAGTEVEGTGIDRRMPLGRPNTSCRRRLARIKPTPDRSASIDSKKGVMVGPGSCL
jgi:hypothetical protein